MKKNDNHISLARALREQVLHNQSVLESFAEELNANPPPKDTTIPQSINESEMASSLIGITATMMTETIIEDIKMMLRQHKEFSLQGYIFALYRIVAHETAWKCISSAYGDQKQTIPTEYFTLFNKTKQEAKKTNRMQVQ